MFFIALAFFAVLPEPKESSSSKAVTYGASTNIIGNFIFGFLMIVALADIAGWASGFSGGISGFLSGSGLIIITIWLFSFVMGLTGGRAQRPYLGVLVLGMVVLLYAYSFTGAFGVALFGPMWAPIAGGISAISTPISGALATAETQMYCTVHYMLK